MENRYLNRFQSIGSKTGAQIKNNDAAGLLANQLSTARSVIATQEENTADLFSTAKEMITAINTLQQMMGVEMVKNIPLPNAEISASSARQLGYVQLSMRFLHSGFAHFLEEVYNANSRIAGYEKTLSDLAEYEGDIKILGRLETLDIESLEGPRHTPSPVDSVTNPITPDKLDEKPVVEKVTKKTAASASAKKSSKA